MPSIEWVTPAPQWTTANGSLHEPQLLKLSGDQFLPEFLEAMQGSVPAMTPAEYLADPLHGFGDPEDGDGHGNLKLYHPAHGRFYLVTASLVCRQLGLPDRNVARSEGERTSFVIRRAIQRTAVVNGVQQAATVEQGWVDEGPQRGWRDLVDGRGRPALVRPDEERFPLHAVAASNDGSGANGAGNGGQRKVYYGYIAVGNREKYVERRPVAAIAPAEALRQFEQDVRSSSTLEGDYDFRLDELSSRVLLPWQGIYTATNPADRLDAPFAEKLNEFSLYLILDLADWLQRNLPDVFQAITQGVSLPAGSKRKALVTELQRVKVYVDGNKRSLAQVIDDLAGKIGLVRGEGTEPSQQYNARDARREPPAPDPAFDLRNDPGYLAYRAAPAPSLHRVIQEALAESTAPAVVPGEVIALLQDQVVEAVDADTAPEDGVYFLRLVYERPGCAPVVSQETKRITFAKYFDPDAPARHIRIELPSIKMQDLRKYKRGVGMQMTPELRDVMNRIRKSMLDGDGLAGSAGGWELGMICSFSLQIIFLVAFIVMFIFLIALNFIFWWLPFLKICFPIPRKT